MMNNFDDFQKIGQHNMDAAMKTFAEITKGWQAIITEISDHSKRSIEENMATFSPAFCSRSLRAKHPRSPSPPRPAP